MGALFEPLGMGRPERSRGGLSAPVVAAGIAVAGLIALAAVSYLRDDGDRGMPVAVSPIERIAVAPKPASPAPPNAPPPATSAPVEAAALAAPGLPPVRADQDVEIQNGVRIVRPRRGSAPTAAGRTIQVPGTGTR